MIILLMISGGAPAQAQDADGALAVGKSAGGRDTADGFAWTPEALARIMGRQVRVVTEDETDDVERASEDR